MSHRWHCRPVLAPLVAMPLLAALGLTVYGMAAPRSQLFGRSICTFKPRGKEVALTFDDGPNDGFTEQVLDILDRHGVKATFFLIGKNVEYYPDIACEIVRRGHSIGNHSYAHGWFLPFDSERGAKRDITRGEEAIYAATGQHSMLFRPPRGLRSPSMMRALREEGYRVVTWTAMTSDYSLRQPSATVAQRILAKMQPGSIIVLHDGVELHHGVHRQNMLGALETILHRLQGEGYTLVRLSDVLERY